MGNGRSIKVKPSGTVQNTRGIPHEKKKSKNQNTKRGKGDSLSRPKGKANGQPSNKNGIVESVVGDKRRSPPLLKKQNVPRRLP